MKDDGPLLEALTHRLAECPPEFLLNTGPSDPRAIDVVAVVADHFRALGSWMPPMHELRPLVQITTADAVNRLRIIAVTTWLLHDEWFLARPQLAAAMWSVLSRDLTYMAGLVKAEDVIRDPDRREELVRVVLMCLKLRPRGETDQQAIDRFNTLDSAERLKVVRETRDAEERARKIRERMAAEAAKAAAARYSPE
jgi:hypothetical protein